MPNLEEWRFNLSLLRKAFVYEAHTPPTDANIRMVVDASYSAEDPSSDPSAIIVGYKYSRPTGELDLNILDASIGRFKGIKLPEEIIRMARLWNPYRISIEKFGPGSYDLLHDVLSLLTKDDPLRGSILPLNPRNTNRAKPIRIRKIQTTMLEPDPPFLHIYCPAIFEHLLKEAEDFAFESDRNFERPDDALDCIALMATRGEL